LPYNKGIDMWAAGATTYTLLSGAKPFGYGPHQNERADGPTQEQKSHQRAKILNGEYNFNDPIWQNISDNAKDFLSQLLKVRPSDRFTPEDALNHPWIASQEIDLRSFHYKWRSSSRDRREAARKEKREKMFAQKAEERNKPKSYRDDDDDFPVVRSTVASSDHTSGLSRRQKSQSVLYSAKPLASSSDSSRSVPRTVPSRVGGNDRVPIRPDRIRNSERPDTERTERPDRPDRNDRPTTSLSSGVRTNFTPTRATHTPVSSPSSHGASMASRTPRTTGATSERYGYSHTAPRKYR